MRRKQPVTPQRRSEPRQNEGGSGQAPAGFSAFTPAEERAPSGPAPQVLSNGPSQSPRPEHVQPGNGRYEFLAPRNWRVPTRLVAILLIPVVIGLVFGGLRVNTSFDDYTQADHAEKTARLAHAASELADSLESERDLSAIPLLTGMDDKGSIAKLRARSDQALAAYQSAFAQVSDDASLGRRNDAFLQLVGSLKHLRDNAYKPELFVTATQAAYSTLIAPLMAFDNNVGLGSSNITAQGRAIYGVSLAKASASTQRVLMLSLLSGVSSGTITAPETIELLQQLAVAAKLEQVSLAEFNTGGEPADAKVYADQQVIEATANSRSPLRMPDGHTVPTVQALESIGLAAAQTGQSGHPDNARAADAASRAGLTPENWLQATSGHIKALRDTETTLLDKVVRTAADLKSRAQTDAILNSAIVIASLALAGLLTGFIARSMILGMRVLNSAALEIANHRLPDLVEKLSKTDPDRVDTSVSQIPLWGKDEIGEVARAFDQVHQQAVSLAAEQALLRGNVNAIFTNLSRRSQGLIQRQLALITDLENNEGDPDQLENLFKLDHLATRMRRNGENLLVLAGEEPGRRWNQPVPLVDVLRAASSEVEQYERVELAGIPEAEVVGAAVTDLVHLLAELLENATSFSSPQTRVLVNATRLPDGRVLVEIHDKGIGLTADDFAEINEKLAEPPTVDATISRRMGLFVVGRLSQRHDIRVQLRPSGESAGTTSLVMLPQALTQMRLMPEPEEQFTVSRIFAEQENQQNPWAEQYDGPSAAELGFDDHLTGSVGGSGFSPALEAMQRRRTALEAGPVAPLDAGHEPAAPDESPAESPYADEYGHQPYQQEAYEPEQPYAQDGPAGSHQQQDPYGREQYAQDDYRQDGYQRETYPQEPYQQQYAQDRGQDVYGRDQYTGGYGDQAQYGGYQEQYASNGYQPEQYGQYEQYGTDEPAGHPYPPEPAALPPAPTDQFSLGSGLPQRRPGQQLAGGPVGNTRPAPAQSGGEKPNWFTGAKDTSAAPEPRGHEVSALGGFGPTGPTGASAEWSSANDGDWQRAEQIRQPSAGGVTPSGLPRRVPKQNLVAGNAKSGPQDGPQVSRSPEEVRGRLTNLRRGVEQGRIASGDTGTTGSFRFDPQDLPQQGQRPGNGPKNNSTDLFGGSNHQER